MKRTVAFHTLGCKLNFAETSDLSRTFVACGYQVVDFRSVSDVYVINTCTVTALAEKKCRTVIRQAIRQNPDAKVAVVGCFSQVDPDSISRISGVDYILGNADKHRLPEYLSRDFSVLSGASGSCCFQTKSALSSMLLQSDFRLSYSSDDRTRTFLKIQDGCDYFCSYCAIPSARGRNRNDCIDRILSVVREISRAGVQEIVLTGVNLGEFGKSTGETFFQLIQHLDWSTDIRRYRISSIEPNLLTDEILDFVARSRSFLPHFHIPLQSGSNKILRLMKRRYQREFFADRVQKVLSEMPDAFIAADVIVGFPGECEGDFEDAFSFISSLPLSELHVFPYSERPNTLALGFPDKVSSGVKKERCDRLLQLSRKLHSDFCERHRGCSSEVLWEGENRGGWMYGFTRNYIRVRKPFDAASVNMIETFVS